MVDTLRVEAIRFYVKIGMGKFAKCIRVKGPGVRITGRDAKWRWRKLENIADFGDL